MLVGTEAAVTSSGKTGFFVVVTVGHAVIFERREEIFTKHFYNTVDGGTGVTGLFLDTLQGGRSARLAEYFMKGIDTVEMVKNTPVYRQLAVSNT